jgi:hypothetical protein
MNTITAYDAATGLDVTCDVIAAHDAECVYRSESGTRHYPAEDRFERHYDVRLPDGSEWTATACWTGETNEPGAHIALDEG